MWNSYCFMVAPIFDQSCRVPHPWSGLRSALRSRTRPLCWFDHDVPNTGRCSTVNHHPSSVVHSATTLVHGDVLDRVPNREHELATLIGFLFRNLVDSSFPVPRMSRPAVTRKVTLLCTRVTSFVRCLSVRVSFRAFALGCGLGFGLCFSLCLLPLPWPLAFALAVTGDVFDVHRTSHRVWRLYLGFVSEVSRCPCLVRVQEGLEGVTQLVVFTLELLIVHQQIVFVFRRCVPYHHADLYIVACFSYTQLGVPTTSTGLRTLQGDLPSLATAQPATSRTKCLQDSNPFLSGTRCTSDKLRPVVTVANKACGAWLQVRMVSDDSSLQVGVFAVGCGLCIQKECYASLSTRVRWFSSLNRNSCHLLSSLSNGTGLAANLNISDTPVFIPESDQHVKLGYHAQICQ